MLKKFKKEVLCLILAVIAGCGAFGITMAYMTDSSQETNVVTVGNVTVDLTETDWKPENGKDILPRASAVKNPEVTNTGSVDAWIFLKVTSPKKNIVTVDHDTKRKLPADDVELFSFTPNSKWELLYKTDSDTQTEYIYGYKDIVKAKEKTQSLFDSVTMVNYLEGSIDKNEKLTLPIEAMAVQWNVDKADAGLKKIYDHYLNQEKYDQDTHTGRYE